MKKIFSFFVLLACSTLSFAQSMSSMTGTVTDATGTSIPGVTVTLINSAAGVGVIYATDKDGHYRFPNLPAGTGYMAIFAHAGFPSLRVSNITLSVATTRTQNAVLRAGAEVVMDVSATPAGPNTPAVATSSPLPSSAKPSSQPPSSPASLRAPSPAQSSLLLPSLRWFCCGWW
jgi:hypothetical protein